MSIALTRKQACRLIRNKALFTYIEAGSVPYWFELYEHRQYGDKMLVACFHKTNGLWKVGIKVTWHQVLKFLREYYPRHVK